MSNKKQDKHEPITEETFQKKINSTVHFIQKNSEGLLKSYDYVEKELFDITHHLDMINHRLDMCCENKTSAAQKMKDTSDAVLLEDLHEIYFQNQCLEMNLKTEKKELEKKRDWLLGLSKKGRDAITSFGAITSFLGGHLQKVSASMDSMKEHITSEEKVILVYERERKRLAKELHDSVAQDLSGLKMQADLCCKIAHDSGNDVLIQATTDMKTGLDAAIGKARKIVFDLWPMSLEDLGLESSIGELCLKLTEAYPEMHIEYTVAGNKAYIDLPESKIVSIFRTVQGCMDNVVRHSHAKNVNVKCCIYPKYLNVFIDEDGDGFDLAAVNKEIQSNKCDNYGICSMREQAFQMGYEFSIKTAIGEGSNVIIHAEWN